LYLLYGRYQLNMSPKEGAPKSKNVPWKWQIYHSTFLLTSYVIPTNLYLPSNSKIDHKQLTILQIGMVWPQYSNILRFYKENKKHI
jgi:hypothetical protein